MKKFQSLSGFLMTCNVGCHRGGGYASAVSIPIGFSNDLQLRPTFYKHG